MEFINWLEAKLNKQILQPKKHEFVRSLNYNHSLKLDSDGNISELSSSDYSNRVPYFEVQPRSKFLVLQRISPLSLDFKKIVLALKSYYNDIYDWQVVVYIQAGHMQTSSNEKYYRTVGYWMDQSKDVSNNVPKFFYHGTSTNLWYSSIRSKGLMPRKLSGSTGSYGAQNISSLSKPDLVYLSAHPDAAARTAAVQSAEKHGGRPMIIKIDSGSLFSDKFVPDEDALGAKSFKDSLRIMSVIGYSGRIPSSALVPFLIGERNGKWEKFHDVSEVEHPLTVKARNRQVPYSGDVDYYVLKDAGIIKRVDTVSDSGHTNYHYDYVRDVSDDEVKRLMKNSGWVAVAKYIMSDLGNGYRGIIYGLKNESVKELNDKQRFVIDLLLDSKLLLINNYKDDSYYDVNDWNSEDKVIKLAKNLYNNKISIEDFFDIIKSVVK